jgi:hypothetical protein
VNPYLNQLTLTGKTLSDFGVSSIAELNTQLQTLSTQALNSSDLLAYNSYFTVGNVQDQWYLNIH